MNIYNLTTDSNARRTCEIKSRITTTKAAFNRKMILKFKEVTRQMLHLEHSIITCSDLDISESRSEIPGKILKRGVREGRRSFGAMV